MRLRARAVRPYTVLGTSTYAPHFYESLQADATAIRRT